jgi:acyl-CoA reductase-like NAD-dependent aldehyde dehydrogenase
MKKHLLLTAAALALALPAFSTLSFADPREHGWDHHDKMTPEDMAAFTNARIAALKAGLELTPAQEKNWPALETALRDMAKARAERMKEWSEKREEKDKDHNLLALMQMKGKALEARGAEIEKLADAAKPLYESLDDAQKRRFGMLLHGIARPHHHHMHGMAMHDSDKDNDD